MSSSCARGSRFSSASSFVSAMSASASVKSASFHIPAAQVTPTPAASHRLAAGVLEEAVGADQGVEARTHGDEQVGTEPGLSPLQLALQPHDRAEGGGQKEPENQGSFVHGPLPGCSAGMPETTERIVSPRR